jgi:hypothetical protein
MVGRESKSRNGRHLEFGANDGRSGSTSMKGILFICGEAVAVAEQAATASPR